MIPRTLVPVDVRPVDEDEAKKTPRRVSTYMDDRTVVPSELADAPPLDGRTSIPAHLPLGVLVERTLVPRGMEVKPLEKLQQVPTLPLEILDSRIVVPAHVEPLAPETIERSPRKTEVTAELRELIDPDIFITGNANLLIEPEVKRDPRSKLITQVLSVLVHIGFIIFLIFSPKIFPPHVPTEDEINLARRQLQWIYTPPEVPKAPAPTPKVRINPKTLRKIAPPVEQPTPEPVVPPRPAPDLPEAPKPRSSAIPAPAEPAQPAPSRLEPIQPREPPETGLNLQLPQLSPGKAIQNQMQDAIRRGGGGLQMPGGAIPQGRGRGPGMQPWGQILTPTEGVDFSSYIQRLLASIRRNWEAVMPESARMGDQGMVYTIFQINRDGSIPSPYPQLERTSGKEPLDNAAMSAIHASNPFEPLPSQFHGPYIQLRIVFLYNLPIDYAR
ncbi:MAG TPA: TonB C-terminal domain-containing protein [Candidatus Polarisedimenticolia bacterium]|nr:TonB C-terminal domain-containing protein [Candidatus Polarisedimenticolia bacterium]